LGHNRRNKIGKSLVIVETGEVDRGLHFCVFGKIEA
jgi:hypothetical protein